MDISGSVVAIPTTDTDASGNPYEITNVTQNQTSNYDNYNHFMQTSTNTNIINGTTFYGPMGETAQFYTTANGTQIFKLTINNQVIIFTASKTSTTQFNGANGGSATIVQQNGQTTLIIQPPNGGKPIVLTTTPPPYQNNTGMSTQTNDISANTTTVGSNYNTAYYGSTGAIAPDVNATLAYSQPMAPMTTTPTATPTATATASSMSTTTPYPYDSVYPPGIPKSQIPPGQDDLYILKSQIVPPVCPAPPVVINKCDGDGTGKKCICPAPQPCPTETQFECKKVPNYNSINTTWLPQPVLNSFSSFGM